MCKDNDGRSKEEKLVQLLQRNIFTYYPRLLTKSQLIEKYPWTNERITYTRILTSYREPNNSNESCLISLFTIHNELINAWAHIIGIMIGIYCLIKTINTEKINISDMTVLSFYCITGLMTLISSSTYHIFCCHSNNACFKVQCMDWLGILIHAFSCNLITSYFELKNDYTVIFKIFSNIQYAICLNVQNFTLL